MEIYTDKAQGKAVIVVDNYELSKLQSASFRACMYWYNKANGEKEIGEADTDKKIADMYGTLSQQLMNAYNQLEEKEN